MSNGIKCVCLRVCVCGKVGYRNSGGSRGIPSQHLQLQTILNITTQTK